MSLRKYEALRLYEGISDSLKRDCKIAPWSNCFMASDSRGDPVTACFSFHLRYTYQTARNIISDAAVTPNARETIYMWLTLCESGADVTAGTGEEARAVGSTSGFELEVVKNDVADDRTSTELSDNAAVLVIVISVVELRGEGREVRTEE